MTIVHVPASLIAHTYTDSFMLCVCPNHLHINIYVQTCISMYAYYMYVYIYIYTESVTLEARFCVVRKKLTF